ncbi:MAG: superoxide dismutase [Clostridium sp.]|nr:superoxide dismutase [Clostridium sp.]MCM1444606.1 superoxide dismutase [Candidatus Amulumruptor caecigallinarius]
MYNIKKLKYSFNEFEPYLSEETLKKHYRLYINYVNKLNSLLPENNYSMEEIIKNIEMYPIEKRGDILYNASAILNHEMYFDSLSLNKNKPVGLLKDKIDKQYGSFDNFKNEIITTASYLKGSGYTFLVLNNENLDIINTPNQDNPYSYNLIPIMALDLWEHAYYLDYFNRQEYIDNFFSIVDFEEISHNYEKIKEKIKEKI